MSQNGHPTTHLTFFSKLEQDMKSDNQATAIKPGHRELYSKYLYQLIISNGGFLNQNERKKVSVLYASYHTDCPGKLQKIPSQYFHTNLPFNDTN